ncbi:hypothetical protein [Nocardia arizonensis]|nr:hypothetical protein [Nocardia arizonensis]
MSPTGSPRRTDPSAASDAVAPARLRLALATWALLLGIASIAFALM